MPASLSLPFFLPPLLSMSSLLLLFHSFLPLQQLTDGVKYGQMPDKATKEEARKFFHSMERVEHCLRALFHAIDHSLHNVISWDEFLTYLVDATQRGRIGEDHNHSTKASPSFRLAHWSRDSSFDPPLSLMMHTKYVKDIDRILQVWLRDVGVVSDCPGPACACVRTCVAG